MKRKNSAFFRPVYIVREINRSGKEQKRLYHQKLREFPQLKNIYDLEPIRFKKSDTLYIFGSGPSINDISETQWEEIRGCDSAAINNWTLHPFAPDFYFFEPSRTHKNIDDYWHNLSLQKSNYSNSIIFLKDFLNRGRENDLVYLYDTHITKDNSFPPIYAIPGLYIPYMGEEFRKYLKLYSFLSGSRSSRKFSYLFEKRGSVTTLIHFGWFMKYKRIILAGVDLNNSDYFFLHAPGKYEEKGFIVPVIPAPEKANWTMDETIIREMTMDKVIYDLNDYLLKPSGIELFVMFKNSALYPKIPAIN